jgi:hypothetical protein
MSSSREITSTLYTSHTEARQAAWDLGFRVVPRPDTRNIMARGDDVIRMVTHSNCVSFEET